METQFGRWKGTSHHCTRAMVNRLHAGDHTVGHHRHSRALRQRDAREGDGPGHPKKRRRDNKCPRKAKASEIIDITLATNPNRSWWRPRFCSSSARSTQGRTTYLILPSNRCELVSYISQRLGQLGGLRLVQFAQVASTWPHDHPISPLRGCHPG
jgi:hypothetical protein